jgi:hypothetical protein
MCAKNINKLIDRLGFCMYNDIYNDDTYNDDYSNIHNVTTINDFDNDFNVYYHSSNKNTYEQHSSMYNIFIDELIKCYEQKYDEDDDEIINILCGSLYMFNTHIKNKNVITEQNHNDIINETLYKVKQTYCNHNIIDDYIDTGIDKSMPIQYCTLCEFTQDVGGDDNA